MLLLSAYVLFWPDPAGGGSGPPGADKVVHAGLFALLASTSRLQFGGHRRVLLALVGYAAGSELAQAVLLPTRSGDVGDLVADLLGVAAGWWLAGPGHAGRSAGRRRPRTS